MDSIQMDAAKKPRIQRIIRAAELYEANLLNKNILLVGEKDGDIKVIELRFRAENFMHLIGVRMVESNYGGMYFWKKYKSHQLSERDILPDFNGAANQKLQAATTMFRSDLSARSFGKEKGVREKVSVDIYSGDIHASLGFRTYKTAYYDPTTMLKSSISKEVYPEDSYRVVGMLSKRLRDSQYDTLLRSVPDDKTDTVKLSMPKEYAQILKSLGL